MNYIEQKIKSKFLEKINKKEEDVLKDETMIFRENKMGFKCCFLMKNRKLFEKRLDT